MDESQSHETSFHSSSSSPSGDRNLNARARPNNTQSTIVHDTNDNPTHQQNNTPSVHSSHSLHPNITFQRPRLNFDFNTPSTESSPNSFNTLNHLTQAQTTIYELQNRLIQSELRQRELQIELNQRSVNNRASLNTLEAQQYAQNLSLHQSHQHSTPSPPSDPNELHPSDASSSQYDSFQTANSSASPFLPSTPHANTSYESYSSGSSYYTPRQPHTNYGRLSSHPPSPSLSFPSAPKPQVAFNKDFLHPHPSHHLTTTASSSYHPLYPSSIPHQLYHLHQPLQQFPPHNPYSSHAFNKQFPPQSSHHPLPVYLTLAPTHPGAPALPTPTNNIIPSSSDQQKPPSVIHSRPISSSLPSLIPSEASTITGSSAFSPSIPTSIHPSPQSTSTEKIHKPSHP